MLITLLNLLNYSVNNYIPLIVIIITVIYFYCHYIISNYDTIINNPIYFSSIILLFVIELICIYFIYTKYGNIEIDINSKNTSHLITNDTNLSKIKNNKEPPLNNTDISKKNEKKKKSKNKTKHKNTLISKNNNDIPTYNSNMDNSIQTFKT